MRWVAVACLVLLMATSAEAGLRKKVRRLQTRVTVIEDSEPEGVVVRDADEEFIGVPQVQHPNGGFLILTNLDGQGWVVLNAPSPTEIAELPGVLWDEPTCTGQRYVRPSGAGGFYEPAGLFAGDVEVAGDGPTVEIGPIYFRGVGDLCPGDCCPNVDFPTADVVPVEVIGTWPFVPPYELHVED